MKLKVIRMYLWIMIIALTANVGCQNNRPKEETKEAALYDDLLKEVNPLFPYSIGHPTQNVKLPITLREISALSFKEDTRELISINDELGNAYFVDIATGEINSKIKFGIHADYEGIELVGNNLYMINSNGKFLKYDITKDIETVESVQTRFDYHNNIEALGYDSISHSLLMGCKDDAHLKGQEKIKGKAIYKYSLTSNTLNTNPFLIIKDKQLLQWYSDNVSTITKDDKESKRISSFSPSGIAVHPESQYYYITSARGDLLVVMDRKGGVVHLELLNNIGQAEGICFDPEANLYICSEGANKKGRLFIYEKRS